MLKCFVLKGRFWMLLNPLQLKRCLSLPSFLSSLGVLTARSAVPMSLHQQEWREAYLGLSGLELFLFLNIVLKSGFKFLLIIRVWFYASLSFLSLHFETVYSTNFSLIGSWFHFQCLQSFLVEISVHGAGFSLSQKAPHVRSSCWTAAMHGAAVWDILQTLLTCGGAAAMIGWQKVSRCTPV